MLYRYILLFVFTINSSTVLGQHFTRSIDNKILLQDSCKKIGKTIEAISQWRKDGQCQNLKVENAGEGQCVAEVNSCLTDFANKYLEKSSVKSGPNCWNSALVVGKLLPHLRESSDEEFDFFVKSPLCRQLGKNEKPKTGDIGSIESRSPEGESFHVHAFIHIADNIVYNKKGVAVKDLFKLESYEKMHKSYPVGKLEGECYYDCAPIEDISDFFPQAYYDSHEKPSSLPSAKFLCNIKDDRNALRALLSSEKNSSALVDSIEYACTDIAKRDKDNKEMCPKVCPLPQKHFYRCDSTEDYVSKLSQKSQSLYNELNAMTTSLEKLVQDELMLGKKVVSSKNKYFDDQLLRFVSQLKQTLPKDKTNLSKEEKFIIKLIYLRWKGVDYSLKVSQSFDHPLRANMVLIMDLLKKLQ